MYIGNFKILYFFCSTKGKSWIRQMIISASFIPGLVCGSTFLINFVAMYYKASRAIPFGTMVAIAAICLFVILPLTLVGTFSVAIYLVNPTTRVASTLLQDLYRKRNGLWSLLLLSSLVASYHLVPSSLRCISSSRRSGRTRSIMCMVSCCWCFWSLLLWLFVWLLSALISFSMLKITDGNFEFLLLNNSLFNL